MVVRASVRLGVARCAKGLSQPQNLGPVGFGGVGYCEVWYGPVSGTNRDRYGGIGCGHAG